MVASVRLTNLLAGHSRIVRLVSHLGKIRFDGTPNRLLLPGEIPLFRFQNQVWYSLHFNIIS